MRDETNFLKIKLKVKNPSRNFIFAHQISNNFQRINAVFCHNAGNACFPENEPESASETVPKISISEICRSHCYTNFAIVENYHLNYEQDAR